MNPPHDATLAGLEASRADSTAAFYELTLFVSGASDLSAVAIANARHLCDTYLADRHRLTVVDVHEDMTAVLTNQVLATPTLVLNLPAPSRKVIGDLSRTAKVLSALGIPGAEGPAMAAVAPSTDRT
jgi:circadian clock protein KaiB